MFGAARRVLVRMYCTRSIDIVACAFSNKIRKVVSYCILSNLKSEVFVQTENVYLIFWHFTKFTNPTCYYVDRWIYFNMIEKARDIG